MTPRKGLCRRVGGSGLRKVVVAAGFEIRRGRRAQAVVEHEVDPRGMGEKAKARCPRCRKFRSGYIPFVSYAVEYTDEFEEWWESLDEDEQESVDASVGLLESRGPLLAFPHSSGIKGSKHGHMRELHIQRNDRPLRTF